MRVGPYQLEAQLGRGGMGSVWVGVHEATGARHAVKLLDLADDAELRVRLGREAEALGRLSHPNLVAVHGGGVDGGRPWLAMELVGGGDLAGRLRTGPLAPADVVALGQALAAGLAHAHARGVLHRDLKPGNVVFGEDGAPRLVDFGVARVAGAAALTRTGGALGTPGYAAPEQLGGGEVDARADVYGLGALLYHALTGQPPYQAASPIAAVAGALQGPPAPSSVAPALRGDPLAPALEAIVLRALAFDPGDRFASAEAVGRALAEVGAGRPRRRAGGALLALGGGAVAAGAVLAAALAGGRAPPPPPVEPAPVTPTPAPTSAPTARPTSAPTPEPTAAPGPLLEDPPPGVQPLLTGAREPEEALARAARAWEDPAARPGLADEVGAALLLAGPTNAAWPVDGLSPGDAAWVAVCAGAPPPPGADARLVQAAAARDAAAALGRARDALLLAPLDFLEAADGLVAAAEAARPETWQGRLVRLFAQRQLTALAESVVHFSGMAVAKQGQALGRIHARLLAAEALCEGPEASALRVVHAWALRPRKGDDLPPGITPPAPPRDLVLPPRLRLLEVVGGALEALSRSPAQDDLATAEGLRRRMAALFDAAAPLGGLDRSPERRDRPLVELLRPLREHDAFAASWIAWLLRGSDAEAAALEAAWKAGELVVDPPDRSRHLARVELLRGRAAAAAELLDSPEPPRDWRAAYLFEVALLRGQLEEARALLAAIADSIRPPLALALDAVEGDVAPEELRARVRSLKARNGQLPWRSRDAMGAFVEATAGGWRPWTEGRPAPPAR